jgi:pimeloyl-ACP methyl ester carboxylesterase
MTLLLLISLLLGGSWLYSPDKDRTELEALYAGPPSQFITVSGLRVHVRDTGPATPGAQAPTVLLLHGFGASLHTWDDWALTLDKTHRVIRLDLPGAGLTGADPTGDYSDTRGLQIINGLLDTLGVAQAVVVGHSMGGRLAWRLAAEQPQRVSQLVLIAPDGFASPGFEFGKPPEVGISVRAMRHVLPKALLRASLAPAYADASRLNDSTVDRYYDMLLAPQVRAALIARMEQLVLQEPTPWLARIQAPTLLLWGEKDMMIPLANADAYLRALPPAAQVKLMTLPDVGHLPHEEAPAASLSLLLRFIGG